MRLRLLFPVLLVLLLSGCAPVPIQKQEIVPPPDIDEVVQQAEQLHNQQRFSEAENLLMLARRHYPKERQLQQLLAKVVMQRIEHNQLIEDQLLAAQIELVFDGPQAVLPGTPRTRAWLRQATNPPPKQSQRPIAPDGSGTRLPWTCLCPGQQLPGMPPAL